MRIFYRLVIQHLFLAFETSRVSCANASTSHHVLSIGIDFENVCCTPEVGPEHGVLRQVEYGILVNSSFDEIDFEIAIYGMQLEIFLICSSQESY